MAHATVRRLSDVKGISEAKIIKLKGIVKQMVAMEFQTATDALEARKNIVQLTTGSVEIDKLLEGGIETGSITEVVSHRCRNEATFVRLLPESSSQSSPSHLALCFGNSV